MVDERKGDLGPIGLRGQGGRGMLNTGWHGGFSLSLQVAVTVRRLGGSLNRTVLL